MVVTLVNAGSDGRAAVVGGLVERFCTATGTAEVLMGRIAEASAGGTVLELEGLGEPGGHRPEPGSSSRMTVRLATAGRHNAANALCVAGAALALGLPSTAIARGLASFRGVGRRLEHKGERRGVAIYDDYGHHPTAIRETVAAVRQLEPRRRVWVACEPLTYHRTVALLDELAAALATADAVAIAEIWAGRDLDTTGVTPGDVAAAVASLRPEIPVAAPGSVEATADWLAGEVRRGDVVLVMGGGRSYRIAERLLERLAENE